MPRKFRLILILGGGIFGVLLLLLIGLYWASRYEPPFYRQAHAADPANREKRSEEMLRKVLALQNHFKREGEWEAVFTAEQINGWLAHDFRRNHPQALPPEFREPCVAIESRQMQLACRYEKGPTASVLCLAVEPYVPEPNVLALKIVRARAGLLPLPLGDVLDGISEAVRGTSCTIDWKQVEGNPVALIAFPTPDKQGELAVTIKTVKLRDGEIFISGSTKRNKR
ncbi:MAG: hypothetical protein IT426_00270 [Pirellulales bacterium]|nr:hypothetical protein [Pirellulales bacterium]